MQEDQFRLDRKHVTAMSFEEADDHVTYWLTKTEDERLNAACFLINQLYGVTAQTQVDRTILDHKKLCNGKFI